MNKYYLHSIKNFKNIEIFDYMGNNLLKFFYVEYSNLKCQNSFMIMNNTNILRKSISYVVISKPTIVIDLDDTIVHVTPLQPRDLDNNQFFTITVKKRRLFVQMRPYLHHFLEKISKIFDIYFYTASDPEYANPIIEKIMPNIKKNHCFYRNSCLNVYGYYVKDLNVIRRPLKQILLIDDSAGSALKNPKNLVKIKPWNGEKDDKVLKDLLSILEGISLETDLRTSFIEAVKNSKFDGISSF